MEEFKKLRKNCTKHILGHRLNSNMKYVYQILTDSIQETEEFDICGQGDLIENFENRIALTLGKDKAVFMPSGTMAQQIALRIWCDEKKNYKVAFHPTAHLEFAEHLGYQYLHDIKRIQFGGPEFIGSRMLTVKDFESLGDIPAVILLELPYRPLGGELPDWESLLEIKEWAVKNNVIMHLDGARIWETKHFYNKEYSEICSIFDSVYVSFYKGLGGLTGSILAGSEKLINNAKIWQRRYGGNLFTLSPYVLSARHSFTNNLEKMSSFVLRAQEIAKILSNYPKIRIHPNPPKTNMFLMYIDEKASNINEKQKMLMEKYKASLFPFLSDSSIPGFVKTEIHIFENALQFENELLEKMLKDLFE
jgi:threonine aldolase